MKASRIIPMLAMLAAMTSVASAQIVGSTNPSAARGATVQSATMPFLWQGNESLPPPTAANPQSEVLHLSHFDSQKPRLGFAAPASIDPYTVLALGERMTLPQSTGFVDSVTFVLDTSIGDDIIVLLAPDTLFEASPNQYFHLMNTWIPQAFAQTEIPFPDNRSRVTITVPFGHIQVPQNFWVAVIPKSDGMGGSTSSFLLEGDSGTIVPRTADNCFSGFLALLNGQQFTGIFDSTFYGAGGTPLYSNFNITAHVTLPDAAVEPELAKSSPRLVPNPASNWVELEGGTHATTSEVFDNLGRRVLNTTSNQFSVQTLPAGMYTVVTHHPDAATTTERLVVRK